MKDRKNVITFVDTETTGLDPRRHEILSIGFITVEETRSGDKVEHKLLDELELKIKPVNLTSADPIAFKINKYTPEKWSDALTAKEALPIMQRWLVHQDEIDQKINKVIIAGHNVHFDLLMIASYFERHGISWNPRHALDTYSIARKALKGEIELESYALNSICDYYGVENEAAHTALSDTRACLAIYQKMMAVSIIE